MTEVDEVVYTGKITYTMMAIKWPDSFMHFLKETPEYGMENFLSDVGGTAGLILGMSFATVIGLIDIGTVRTDL